MKYILYLILFLFIVYIYHNNYSHFFSYISSDLNISIIPKIAIIFPYRNQKEQKRDEQLNNILNYYKNLNNPNIDIYIIEQSNDKLFNRGSLLNIGHTIINNLDKYQNEIHHDIDMIPDSEMIKYFFINKVIACKVPDISHVGRAFIGGIISVPLNIMNQVNGYSNNFWGWGREDDNFLARLYAQHIKLYRPITGSIDEINHPKARELKLDSNFNNNKQIDIDEIKNGFDSGLSDLEFIVKNKEIISNNFIKYSVTF